MKILRVFPICLILSLLIFNLNSFADNSIRYEKETELMKYLGFIPAQSDEEASVKRGEFCEYLMKAFNLTEGDKKAISSKLYDISETTKYSGAISRMFENGIISGYEDKMFYPNDNIEPNQAIRMIINGLGYSYVAQSNGGYPNGYLSTATNVKLLNGLSFKALDKVSYSEACKLLSNLLDMKYLYNSTSNVLADKDDIFREKCLDLYKTTGIVGDDGISSLSKESTIGSDNIMIDNVLYENPNGFRNMLGRNVTAYYSKDNDSYVLVYMYENTVNNTVKFNADDLEGYTTGKYVYYDNLKTRNAELSKSFVLVYNGITVSDGTLFSDELMKPKNGTIVLLDNNGDQKYDFVFVDEYRTLVVSKYDEASETFYDELGGKPLVLKDTYDSCYICDDAYVAVPVEEIQAAGNVFMIYESACKKFVRIVDNNSNITSNITSASVDDGKTVITIDGEDYKLTKELEGNSLSKDIAVGKSGKFFLNANNEISYIDFAAETDIKSAYFVRAYIDDDDVVKITLYSEGTEMVLNASGSLKIDGYRMKNSDEIISKLSMLSDENAHMILFMKNQNNDIISIDTIFDNNPDVAESNSVLRRITSAPVSGYTSDYFSQTNILFSYSKSGFCAFKKNALVYFIASPYEGDKQLCTTDLMTFWNYGKFEDNHFYFYTTEDEHFLADIILIIPSDWDRTSFGKISHSLVTKVSEAVNDDDERGYELSVVQGAVEKTIFVDNEAINYSSETGMYVEGHNDRQINKGDCIKFINLDIVKPGKIGVLFCPETGKFISMVKNPQYITSENRLEQVWLYDEQDGFFRTSNQKPTKDTVLSELSVCNLNSAKIIKWDGKEYKLLNLNDLLTYKSSGDDCYMGILYTNRESVSGTVLVIYE